MNSPHLVQFATRIRRLLLLLAIVDGRPALAAINQAPASNAEGPAKLDWDALQRSTQTEALIFPPSSRGGDELRRELKKSIDHLWLEPERARYTGAPGAEAASTFMEDAARWILSGSPRFQIVSLLRRAEKLKIDDPAHPALCFVAGDILRMSQRFGI